MRATIIGGSLAGLTFALACANRGIRTQVLERAVGSPQTGGALGIDRQLMLRVVGTKPQDQIGNASFPPLTARRHAATWQAVHTWLRAQIVSNPQITLIEGVVVHEIADSSTGAMAMTEAGQRIYSDCIVGADGSHSLVRRAINPEQPHGSYAGYLLWRGLVREADLTGVQLPAREDGVTLHHANKYKLVAYPVAAQDGSLRMGERSISFTWYDAGQTQLLKDLRCLGHDGAVVRAPNTADIPQAVLEELSDLATRIWPDPWSSAIRFALARREVFASPVEEYLPPRLCRGRLAVIGDAAHAVSPVTGRGFTAGLLDAETLAECLACHAVGAGKAIPAALAAFEEKRLPEVHALVVESTAWSQVFARGWFSGSRVIPDERRVLENF